MRSEPDLAAGVRLAVEVNVTVDTPADFEELGSHTPVSDGRSPTRSSHRADELWSKPMPVMFRFPMAELVVPPAGAAAAPPPPAACAVVPAKFVSQTSLGMTVAISWSRRVLATSLESALVTSARRWAIWESRAVTD